MASRIWGRETCGCLSVKTEPFIVVRITQNEDSGPAFATGAAHSSLNQGRANTAPLSRGNNRYGGKRQGREWRVHLGQQSVTGNLAAFIGQKPNRAGAGFPQFFYELRFSRLPKRRRNGLVNSFPVSRAFVAD